MNKNIVIYLSILLISAGVVCFEIVSTRISSVIFVNNYAFIILSLAILGLGMGGIYSHFRIKSSESEKIYKIILRFIILLGISFLVFILAVIQLRITSPFIYFSLLFFPFFLAGIIYAQIFKYFAKHSFLIYAFDLVGAASGSLASILLLNHLGAPNSVIFLSLLIFWSAFLYLLPRLRRIHWIIAFALLILFSVSIISIGDTNISGKIPIGNFPEKDFYHVYPNASTLSQFTESRWSIHGRADLVQYRNQDMVRQLFIDGAAGTQMYRFSGDLRKPARLLQNLLISQTSSIPFLFLTESEKDNMLVIGPGGGKEILTGLLGGVGQITGVEINPDFVSIVKEYRAFNGGIYTDFPNVHIAVAEGRHYIKNTYQHFDLIAMALASTEQLQNIDNFAMSENYLLTVEAIRDYLNILTLEGRLIFTVHNRWELIRLIVTTMFAFKEFGIQPQHALNHFIILADDYNPTLVIKKQAFTRDEIASINQTIQKLPPELPSVTYLPYHWNQVNDTHENRLLKTVKSGRVTLSDYIKNNPYDLSPVYDDSPYFYKVARGIPKNYLQLLAGILCLSVLVVVIPYLKIKKKHRKNIGYPLIVFISIGLGFMILEISLFQKLVLYLGSPTISLSILLSSLLIGMSTGSYFGDRLFSEDLTKRIQIVSLLIVIAGILLINIHPRILNLLLVHGQVLRSAVNFILLLPFGFLLGILFPSAIKMLKNNNLETCIPWMYGINGICSVLASLLAVIFSMLFGFTFSFYLGLSMYFILFLVTIVLGKSNSQIVN